MDIYIVTEGDTIDAIAARYGVAPGYLAAVNQIAYPYRLAVGQAILVLYDGQDSGQDEPLRKKEISVNGYAYPFIDSRILGQTLPYLTDMSVFSYGFTAEGELLAPPLPDEWMTAAGIQAGTRPILTLTPFGADGRFNNRLIHSVVRNEQYAERLTDDLLEVMRAKRYMGLDIDFEYILAEDRDYFTAFVRRMTEVMNDSGFTVSVALAPKTSAEQQGLLYEGKDYRALGEAANSVLLMTYEWGYTYRRTLYSVISPYIMSVMYISPYIIFCHIFPRIFGSSVSSKLAVLPFPLTFFFSLRYSALLTSFFSILFLSVAYLSE